jgi:hypothetical protein
MSRTPQRQRVLICPGRDVPVCGFQTSKLQIAAKKWERRAARGYRQIFVLPNAERIIRYSITCESLLTSAPSLRYSAIPFAYSFSRILNAF